MKIVIVAWGEVGNNIVTAAKEEFQKQGIETSIIGILKCKDHPKPFDIFRKRIVKESPDVILWWFWACDFDFIKIARGATPDSLQVMFNWDDPHCWTYKLNKMKDRLQYFDMTLVCSSEKLEEYRKIVPESHLYFPPFSPKYHYHDYDEKFSCDVSFICTNLYGDKDMFPDQFVDRRSLLQAFEKSSLNFHLYGPESIKAAAPTSYQGPVDFAINRKVFSSSKINLCTHVITAQNYLNERVVTCLASKGLLLTDPTPGLGGFLQDGEHVVTMKSNDPEAIVKQAEDIIACIGEYEKIRERGKEVIQRQHLCEWTKGILEKIHTVMNPKIVVLMHGYSKESVDSLDTDSTILVSCSEECNDPRVTKVEEEGSETYVTFNRMLHHVTHETPIVVLWNKEMRMQTKDWETILKNNWNTKLLSYNTPSPLTVVTHAFAQRFNHTAYALPIHRWVHELSNQDSPYVDIQVMGYIEETDKLYDSNVMRDVRSNFHKQ